MTIFPTEILVDKEIRRRHSNVHFFVLFRVSFSAKVYAPGPHGDCIVSTKQTNTCLLYTSPSPRD